MRTAALAALLSALVLLAGCGDDEGDSGGEASAETRSAAAGEAAQDETADRDSSQAAPTANAETGSRPDSGEYELSPCEVQVPSDSAGPNLLAGSVMGVNPGDETVTIELDFRWLLGDQRVVRASSQELTLRPGADELAVFSESVGRIEAGGAARVGCEVDSRILFRGEP